MEGMRHMARRRRNEQAENGARGIDTAKVATVLAILLLASIAFSVSFLVTRNVIGGGTTQAEPGDAAERQAQEAPAAGDGEGEAPDNESDQDANPDAPPLADRLREFESRRDEMEARWDADERFGGTMMEIREAAGEHLVEYRALVGELRFMLIDEYGFDADALDAWRDEFDQHYEEECDRIDAENFGQGSGLPLMKTDAGLQLAEEHMDRLLSAAWERAA